MAAGRRATAWRRGAPLALLTLLAVAGRSCGDRVIRDPPQPFRLLATLPAHSALQCGLLCAGSSRCNAVLYGADTGNCTLLDASSPACGAGWESFGRRCYKYFDTKLPWMAAEEICGQEAAGGHLVSITFDGEQDFVASLVQSNVLVVHIGLRHLPDYGDGQFRWIDGSPLNFTAWYPSQPNGNMGTVLVGNLMTQLGVWNDMTMKNSYRLRFVCKY